MSIGPTEDGLLDLRSLRGSGNTLRWACCYAFDQTRHYDASALEHLVTDCPGLTQIDLSFGSLSDIIDDMDAFAPCVLSAFEGMKQLLVSLRTSGIGIDLNLDSRMCLLDIQ